MLDFDLCGIFSVFSVCGKHLDGYVCYNAMYSKFN